jgi:hypothetical protein
LNFEATAAGPKFAAERHQSCVVESGANPEQN